VDHDLVSFRDHILSGESQVGKGGPAHTDMPFNVFRAGCQSWERLIMVTALVCHEFANRFQLSLVPALFHESPGYLFVLRRHW
jgi:hypothetical protein